MADLTQCPSSRLGGARCTLEAGHTGSHMQIDPNGVTGWAQESASSWTSSGSLPGGES